MAADQRMIIGCFRDDLPRLRPQCSSCAALILRCLSRPYGAARMENRTKPIPARLRTIIAIAATSIMESGAMRQFAAVERQR